MQDDVVQAPFLSRRDLGPTPVIEMHSPKPLNHKYLSSQRSENINRNTLEV